jgi:Family of unknown function (DUF6064)
VKIPFTSAEFYGVFSAYNMAVWPMQLPLLALGVLAVVLLIRQRINASVGISAILAFLWVWQALACHLAFFTAINPLAHVGGMESGELVLIVAGVLGLVLAVQWKDAAATSRKAKK